MTDRPMTNRSHGRVRIAAVATSREWRTRVQSYVHDHLADAEFVVIRDPAQVDRSRFDAFFIDDSVALFDDRGIRRMVADGWRIVGVFDRSMETGRGRKFLEHLGIETLLADDAAPEIMVQSVLDEVRGPASGHDDPGHDNSGHDVRPRSSRSSRSSHSSIDARDPIHDPLTSSRLLVVGGPDADISAEIASGLAEAAASRSLPLLIDVNEVDPVVAARLGLRLDPNIIDAVAAATASQSIVDALAVSVERPDDAGTCRFDVVAGIIRPSDWVRLDPNGVERLLAHALDTWDRVIAAVGSRIDDCGRRHHISRSTVAVADELAIVVRPDPIGLLRGLDWLVQARALRPDLAVGIVFYGRPSTYRQQELVNVIVDRVPQQAVGLIEFVPVGGAVDKSRWQGTSMVGGAFHRSLRSIEQLLEITSQGDLLSDDPPRGWTTGEEPDDAEPDDAALPRRSETRP